MNLLDSLKTYEKLQDLLSQLDIILLELPGAPEAEVPEVIQKYAPKYAQVLLLHLQENNAFTHEAALTELQKLSERLDKVEAVELTLALSPSEIFIEALFKWLKENIESDMVIKISRNPSIVAGAIVTYKGKYADYSTANKLKGVFKQLQGGGVKVA